MKPLRETLRAVAITAGVLATIHAASVLAAGCDRTPSDGADKGASAEAGTSPNASILPAPLVTELPEGADAGASDAAPQGLAADSAGRLLLPDSGPPVPEVLRGDAPMTAEPLGPPRDLAGVTLEAVWRWRDVPAPPRAPEVAQDGIKDAQKLTSLTWKIDLADTGRMRIEFTSRALPLPARSEIRARTDRYGTIVVWPNLTGYRVVPPGALRTVLGERRIDVTPLSLGTTRAQGEGKRLGVATRKIELSSSLGTLRLELGKVPDAGEGGPLLCRALVEMIGIDPKSSVCQPAEVPLSAAFGWQDGGGVSVDVTSITRRTDIVASDLLVPSPGLAYMPSGLPSAPDGIFLSRDELQAFRSAPAAPSPNADPTAPGEGFIAANHTDTLMYLLLDGVPIVAVPANADRYVIGPLRGRYVAQWRTFLGERVAPPQTIDMPARLSYGGADAGAPDGG